MINKLLDLRLEKFIKVFKNDSGNILEMLYENYYTTDCEIKIRCAKRYDLIENKAHDMLEIRCYKYVIGEIEHVDIDYNLSEYKGMTVDDFFTYILNQITDKFANIREIASVLTSETINDYIIMYSEGLENE